MNFRPLMELRLETSAVQTLGATPNGTLSIFPIVGGTFEGERLRGRVLPGGADYVTQGTDRVLRLDLRIALETDDAASIAMTLTGVRDDASGYFRTLPRFETAAPRYAFLNCLLAVGIGGIRDGAPVHVLEEIL